MTMRAPRQPPVARFQPAERRRVGLLWPLAQRAGVPLGSGLAARRPSPVPSASAADLAADAASPTDAPAQPAATPIAEVGAVPMASSAAAAAAQAAAGGSSEASPVKANNESAKTSSAGSGWSAARLMRMCAPCQPAAAARFQPAERRRVSLLWPLAQRAGVPLGSGLNTSTPSSTTPATTSSNVISSSNIIISSNDASSNIATSSNISDSTTINGAEVAAATTVSSADEKAYCSVDWPTYQALKALLRTSADAMFEAGAPLAKGGLGEVRRVAVDGVEYALKRSSVSSDEVYYGVQLMGLASSGFVQVRIAAADSEKKGASWEYSLYPLARGDLLTAWGLAPPAGQQEAQPAVAAAPAREGRTTTDKDNSQGSKGDKDSSQDGNTGAKDGKDNKKRGGMKDDKQDGKKKGGVCRRAARWLRKKVGNNRNKNSTSATNSSTSKKKDDGKQQPTAACTPERPSADAFKAVAAEMAVAVALLHGAGLRHNDIKPANYLVGRDGHLRLGDLDGLDDASEPASSDDMITPLYAPAEQQQQHLSLRQKAKAFAGLFTKCFGRGAHEQEPPADSRFADIWALGMSWMHMLLPEEQLFEVFRTVHSRDADDTATAAIAALSAALPEGFGDLVFGGMLRRNASERLTIEGVKAHRFFEGVDWAAVGERRVPLPVDLIARLEAAAALAAKQEGEKE